jgi:hypothetical protein
MDTRHRDWEDGVTDGVEGEMVEKGNGFKILVGNFESEG